MNESHSELLGPDRPDAEGPTRQKQLQQTTSRQHGKTPVASTRMQPSERKGQQQMVSTEGHRRLEVGDSDQGICDEHQHQSRGQTGSKHQSVRQSKLGGPLGVGGATAGDVGSGNREGGEWGRELSGF